MTRTRACRIGLGLACVFMLAVMSGHAAEEAANAAERANEIFKWINFAIVAGLILWVFWKLTPPFFRNNAEFISSAITKATAAKAEADKQLSEAEGRLSRLQQEVAQLRATAEQDRAAEAERIRAATKNDIERVGLAIKAEIEAAERAGRLELRTIAAKLAVEGAETVLVRQLTADKQQALVSAFVKSLEGRPN